MVVAVGFGILVVDETVLFELNSIPNCFESELWPSEAATVFGYFIMVLP